MIPELSTVQKYPLTDEQTKLIHSLAFHLHITGIVISALGLFFCAVTGVFSLNSLGSVIIFLIGFLFIRAAGLFQQISAADNADILLLMEALTALRNAYRLLTQTMLIILIVSVGIMLYTRWLRW